MFSKELENLIQATLEDGILEDYEKAALVKRAEAEGVDLAELEIYINSILQRRKRELAKEQDIQQAMIDQKKKEAFGRVCPNCGKQVPPLTMKCVCGYEFTTTKSVSSIQLLSDKIEAMLSEPYKSKPDTDEYKEEVKQRYQRVKETINLFPVPNTKEDIIEFLSLSVSNAKKKGGIWGTKSGRILVLGVLILVLTIVFASALSGVEEFDGGGNILFAFMLGVTAFAIMCITMSSINPTFIHNDLATAWRAKFDQVLMKGRSLRGDSEFTQQLDYYEQQLK